MKTTLNVIGVLCLMFAVAVLQDMYETGAFDHIVAQNERNI